jgi:MarR family transcriptional regulator for hemolysin
MPRPTSIQIPLGLQLNQAARIIGQAFDEALQAAGGSLPVWLVLLNLKVRPPDSQRELATAVGIREATLTHHLNAMESSGLLARRRDPGNRRIHIVDLSEDGNALFLRLRDAALSFDRRLREGLPEADLDWLGRQLDRLAANVGRPAPSGSNASGSNASGSNASGSNASGSNASGSNASGPAAGRPAPAPAPPLNP